MLKLCVHLCIFLYSIAAVHAQLIICDDNNRSVDPITLRQIHLNVFKGTDSINPRAVASLDNLNDIADSIDTDKKTIIFVHGFLGNTMATYIQPIIKAYLERGDVNVIVVDWGAIAIDINYIYVASRVPDVGRAIATALEKFSDVIDLTTLHVIGHSLGAHVVGHIGRSMNSSLVRLTGLDPAFPLFYPSSCHITKTDAENVVILHTNGGFYGTPYVTGTIDFFANKGFHIQPGCETVLGPELCSHIRAIDLYAEAVRNPTAFAGRECSIESQQEDNTVIHFGDDTPPDATGIYCFETRHESPYSKT